MDKQNTDREALLDTAKRLVEQLEAGNQENIEALLDEVVSIRESALFQELGKLTRQLHESINSFRKDSRIEQLASTDFPDAKDRLEYVISMTQQSADKTLTAIEEGTPAVEKLKEAAESLQQKWMRFLRKEMDAGEFRDVASEINGFFENTVDVATQVGSHFNDVLMAQEFQDLTGQIIRRVINLVDEVEANLVGLISIQSEHITKLPAQEASKDSGQKQKEKKKPELEGPQIPGKEDADVISGQDEVDDLLASLGF